MDNILLVETDIQNATNKAAETTEIYYCLTAVETSCLEQRCTPNSSLRGP